MSLEISILKRFGRYESCLLAMVSRDLNSSFSIMKVNAVPSLENSKDNKELNSLNRKLIVEKLFNG